MTQPDFFVRLPPKESAAAAVALPLPSLVPFIRPPSLSRAVVPPKLAIVINRAGQSHTLQVQVCEDVELCYRTTFI